MENASWPIKMPDMIVITIDEPCTLTAPVLAGLPLGENCTGVPVQIVTKTHCGRRGHVPALQLNEPVSVMTILPLTGIGLSGLMVMVIETPLPPLAGFDKEIAGDKAPNEFVLTSHMSI